MTSVHIALIVIAFALGALGYFCVKKAEKDERAKG